eukprot:scaffold111553_cov31-Tisochrysis_lutea.AAC.2
MLRSRHKEEELAFLNGGQGLLNDPLSEEEGRGCARAVCARVVAVDHDAHYGSKWVAVGNLRRPSSAVPQERIVLAVGAMARDELYGESTDANDTISRQLPSVRATRPMEKAVAATTSTTIWSVACRTAWPPLSKASRLAFDPYFCKWASRA